MLRTIEDDRLVRLVRVHPNFGTGPSQDHRRDLGELIPARHATGGIRREVEEDHLGAGRNQFPEILPGEVEAGVLTQAQRDRNPSDVPDERLEERVPRRGVNHLIARLEVGVLGESNWGSPPGVYDDALRIDLDPTVCPHLGSNGAPHLDQPLRIAVGGVTGADGVDDGIGNVTRQGKVGLTEVAADHLARLGLDLGDQRPEGKRLLGADQGNAIGEQRSSHHVRRLLNAYDPVVAGFGRFAPSLPVARFPLPLLDS